MADGPAGAFVGGPADHVVVRVGPDPVRGAHLRALHEQGAAGGSRGVRPSRLGVVIFGVLLLVVLVAARRNGWRSIEGLALAEVVGVSAMGSMLVLVLVAGAARQRRRAATPGAHGCSRRLMWLDPLATAAELAGAEALVASHRAVSGNVAVSLVVTPTGIDLVACSGAADRLTVPWPDIASIEIVTAPHRERGTVIGLRSGHELWFRPGGGQHLLPALRLAGADCPAA